MNKYIKYTLIITGSLAVIGGVSYLIYSQYKKAEGAGEVSADSKKNKITFVRG